MSWSSFISMGTAQSKTANQNIITLVTTSAANPPSTYVVVAIALDNTATVDGETSEVASITDSSGANTYVKLKEFCNAQGGIGAGATISLWGSKITSTIPSGGSITATFTFQGANVDASAMAAASFAIPSTSVATVEASASQADDGADPSSMDLTVANLEHLWIRAIAHEGPNGDTFTKSAAYANSLKLGTTGGAAGSNMSVAIETDVFTGTSNPSNPAWTARDCASVLVALKEAASASNASGGWIGKGGWF